MSPKPRLFRRWPAALLILLLLALGALGIWVGDIYRHQVREQMARAERSMALARNRQEDLLARLERAKRLIEAQQRQLEIQGQMLDSTQRHLQQRELDLEDYRERLAEALTETRRLLTQKAKDAARERLSRLAAAQAKVGLAAQRLQDEDPEAAIAALQQAREGLATLPAKALREAIDRALSAIDQARKGPAKDATARRLAELLARIRHLPYRYGHRPPFLPWLRARTALEQQIRGAAFALKQGDTALYRAALDTALLWLETFYEPQARDVMDFTRALWHLKQEAEAPAWPDLRALLEIFTAWQARWKAEDPGRPPGSASP